MLWLCILAVCGILLAYLIYSGLFFQVKVSVEEKPVDGDLEIHYKVGRGPHSSCSAYYEEMKDLVPNLTRIGIFYDDPKTVRVTNLRWIIGVISSVNSQRLIDDYISDRLIRYRFVSLTIPQPNKAIVAEHIYRNNLSLWLAKRKVRAEVQRFQKQTAMAGRPVIEILKGNRIRFILPLDNHQAYIPSELRVSELF